jgi:hypothetical protein
MMCDLNPKALLGLIVWLAPETESHWQEQAANLRVHEQHATLVRAKILEALAVSKCIKGLGNPKHRCEGLLPCRNAPGRLRSGPV